MYNKALHSLLPRAEGLLSGLLLAFDSWDDINMKGIKQTVAEAKALIAEAELLLNPQLNHEPPPQLNKHDVSGRSEQFCKHPDACKMGYYEQIKNYYCSECQKTGLQNCH